jgi:hypothetical protein
LAVRHSIEWPLTLDSKSVWITGTSFSTNFPLLNAGGGSFFQGANNGGGDGFISKFNLLGNLQWSTLYGANLSENLNSIASDGKSVFVGGNTNSTTIFTLNPGNGAFFQGTNAGFFDAVLLKFDSASICTWASYFGSTSNDYVNGVTSNGSKIFATGYSQSIVLPTLNPGGGAYYQTLNAGGLEGFISTFKNCVNPTPTIAVTAPSCINNPITFSVNGGSGFTYQWVGPSPLGFFDTNQNAATPLAVSNYTGFYSVIVTHPNGCQNSDVTNITTLLPSPTVAISTSTAFCPGTLLSFSTTTYNSYLWSGPASFTSNVQSPVIVNTGTANAGVYNITVSGANGCKAYDSKTVIANALPIVSITATQTVCLGSDIFLTGNGGSPYSWTGPNAFSTILQNPNVVNVAANAQGYYVLMVTGTNGCTNKDSVFVTVNVCTGMGEVQRNVYLNMYPNPVRDVLTIEGVNEINNYTIKIFDALGSIVLIEKNKNVINTQLLPKGIYNLILESENILLI